MIDLAQLDAQCIHTLKLALEALLAAGFLTFCWLVAPHVRGK